MPQHVESYEYVKLHYCNARAFPIDLIILINMNVLYERANVSHGFGGALAFGRNLFTRAITVKHKIHFLYLFKFDILFWYC